MQLLRVAWALTGAAICCFLILLIHSRLLKEGQLAAGTCEIVTLDRDSSQPRRTIARQTARCACKKGQIAGTTRARPACVDAAIVRKKQWCEMVPCLEDEGCDLLVNKSGWTCTQPGGRVKTTTRRMLAVASSTPSILDWQMKWHNKLPVSLFLRLCCEAAMPGAQQSDCAIKGEKAKSPRVIRRVFVTA
nr:chemokine-like protein TAFA-5 [Nerophis lumbriciformis]